MALSVLLMASLTACQGFLSDWFKTRPPVNISPTPIASDRFVLPSPEEDVVGEIQVVMAHRGDTLPEIARRFNLGFEEILAANPGVDFLTPGEGRRIVLPTQFILPPAPRAGIVLNLATLRLFYFPKPSPGEPLTVITHPIGIGRVGWSTPLGRTRVTKKERHPMWYVPASIRREHAHRGDPLPAAVPSGPKNPLGDYALRLTYPRYLIHGTNKPYGIGMRVSHGCIQLYPEDIASLFDQVPVGTPVTVVNQPVLIGWHEGQPYLEIHPPLEDDKRPWFKQLPVLIKAQAHANRLTLSQIDWEKAWRLMQAPRGLPVPILVGTLTQEELVANAPWVKNRLPAGMNYSDTLPAIRDEQPRTAPARDHDCRSPPC